jgi:ORF6N domain
MSDVAKIENLREFIIEIRGQGVLLDSDVAVIYGVETKRINEAVKNNPDRFPSGYVIELNDNDKNELVENFDRFNRLKHSSTTPRAFTEKGLYMLATILKSQQALQATLSIIETFSKIRELSRGIKELSVVQDKAEQKSLMQKSGELIAEIFDDDLQTSDTETSIELNFAVLKFKHTIKKKNK